MLLNVLRRLYPVYRSIFGRPVSQAFFMDLIGRTENFTGVTWLGRPIWQNVLDLWITQEVIAQLRPALIIECGTNRGGSALFYAHLFDLMGHGRVITVDVEKMHDLSHPRVTWLLGSSVDPAIVAEMHKAALAASGPVFVILDSDHRAAHVAAELEAYGPMVTPGSYLLVQDGVIDTLPAFRHGRPGPLPAIRAFLKRHQEFEVQRTLGERFIITHHPMGWLRRR